MATSSAIRQDLAARAMLTTHDGARLVGSVADGQAARTYGYDSDGRRTLTSTTAAEVQLLSYDQRGLLARVRNGDASAPVEAREHDGDGVLVNYTSPGARDSVEYFPIAPGANRGAGHLCQAHHIIQNAAVREVDGYSYSTAPAIILTREGHAEATRIQNTSPDRGTYGKERVVARRSLIAAAMAARVDAALDEADRYFMGSLHLRLDSPTRPPG